MKKVANILLLPLAVSACPGSPAAMHAKCQMDIHFSNSCDEVLTEITSRITSPSWTDPHNGGTYSLINSNSTFVSGQRLTGDKKYTDKFDFYFFPSGSACNVAACSESQVSSIIDYSTNYCNLHDLYCSSSDGCPTIGSDLVYDETYSYCSQHDNVCIVNTKKDIKQLYDEEACKTDIKAATTDIAEAGVAIAFATVDCASGYTKKCDTDIDTVLSELTSAAAQITNAVYDCSNEAATACSADINNVLADITDATIAITDAVLSCQVSSTKCAIDVAKAASAITKAGFDIVACVEDC
jgi:hypothetical protein